MGRRIGKKLKEGRGGGGEWMWDGRWEQFMKSDDEFFVEQKGTV